MSKIEDKLSHPDRIIDKYGKLDQKKLKKIYDENSMYMWLTDKIYHTTTDLILNRAGIVLYEIKVTGDIDSKSAPSNIRKMLLSYLSLGKRNAKMYFLKILISLNSKIILRKDTIT